ncbi:unnamed protein product [Pedinophyceae sp. YPF-701]|nr:unnamed protein product [Pedinophyceae sp. YPF-701]
MPRLSFSLDSGDGRRINAPAAAGLALAAIVLVRRITRPPGLAFGRGEKDAQGGVHEAQLIAKEKPQTALEGLLLCAPSSPPFVHLNRDAARAAVPSWPGWQQARKDASDEEVASGLTPVQLARIERRKRKKKQKKAANNAGDASPGEHPFAALIAEVTERGPLEWEYQEAAASHAPHKPPPTSRRQAVLVECAAALHAAVRSLAGKRQVAVDVEHHAFRSYYGLVCLVQLSDGQTDWVIDTLVPEVRAAMGDALRPLLASPDVVKLVHGGRSDVLWLQRDFRLYLVNVFDTCVAAHDAGEDGKSLAVLLRRHCNVTTDKAFQRADWRARPLTRAHLDYARTDVHYLPFIADVLRREIFRRGGAPAVHRAHTTMQAVTAALFPPPDPQRAIMQQVTACMNKARSAARAAGVEADGQHAMARTRCLECAAALAVWRDGVARATDESTQYTFHDELVAAVAAQAAVFVREDGALLEEVTDEAVRAWVLEAALPRDVRGTEAAEKAVARALGAFSEARGGGGSVADRCGVCSACVGAKQRWRLAVHSALLRAEEVARTTMEVLRGSSRRLKESEAVHVLREEVAGGGVGDGGVSAAAGPEAGVVEADQGKTGKFKQGNRRERIIATFSAKKEVYQNCKMLSKEGALLCHCDKKKVDWYLSKGLADLECDDPLTIRLRFQHKTDDQQAKQEQYYTAARTNQCVGCGEAGHYLRYRILPSCYRKRLPEALKSHRSHDIVLLCVDCHEVAHRGAEVEKRRLAQELGVPLNAGGLECSASDASGATWRVSPSTVHRAALALKRHGKRMPQERRAELETLVQAYLGRPAGAPPPTEADVDRAALAGLSGAKRRKVRRQQAAENGEDAPGEGSEEEGDVHEDASGHWVHGRLLVDKIARERGTEGLLDLMARFRRAFVEHVKPRYLPEAWHVLHSATRGFGPFSVYSQVYRENGADDDSSGSDTDEAPCAAASPRPGPAATSSSAASQLVAGLADSGGGLPGLGLREDADLTAAGRARTHGLIGSRSGPK